MAKGRNVNQSERVITFEPITQNQKNAVDAFYHGKNLLLHGIAGTGKTYCALALALKEIYRTRKYQKIVIIRSIVPTRDMGFLPGTLQEKTQIYELPYKALFSEICEKVNAYQSLKKQDIVEFISTSYVRGITLSNCIVIVDEINNMNFHELDSIITRIGENCRIIFCGDYRQSDLTKECEKDGIHEFMDIVECMNSFAFVEFGIDDIVRSSLVKEYIIEKDRIDNERKNN